MSLLWLSSMDGKRDWDSRVLIEKQVNIERKHSSIFGYTLTIFGFEINDAFDPWATSCDMIDCWSVLSIPSSSSSVFSLWFIVSVVLSCDKDFSKRWTFFRKMKRMKTTKRFAQVLKNDAGDLEFSRESSALLSGRFREVQHPATRSPHDEMNSLKECDFSIYWFGFCQSQIDDCAGITCYRLVW